MDADNDRSFENCAKIHHGVEPVQPANQALPRTCSTSDRYSGIQLIHPQPGFGEPFEVYCEQEYEDGGWVVIQNRFDGSVNFERNWAEYEHGFGDMSGEHWLGLRAIHELTYSKQYKLHILLELSNGTQLAAKYNEFSTGSGSAAVKQQQPACAQWA
ncbi:fibrinogen C domain-containing protein 1-like [Culex quinquefasciatus]|uniref:fibrinogen C domain-containing protein 1-like n=1 Tax=Culex quinquefasciatus TaxID=7176 RepID=UPI0018E31205|nr:fibrinogen C domain-containing protein 1-like [Culex quinquefasciatus]